MIVRLLLWSLTDSMTTLEEVRTKLPAPIAGVTWISDEASERFGAVVVGEPGNELDGALERLRELIGKDPEIGENFDVETG
jgi:hypothetical protein